MVSALRLEPQFPLPSPAQLHHIIAHELRDRFVVGLLDTDVQRAKKRAHIMSEETYGEVLQSFVEWLVQTTAIGEGDVFLDVGSGVGQVLIMVAALSGADALGIEIDVALAAHAVRNAALVKHALHAHHRSTGVVASVHGDATHMPVPWPQTAAALPSVANKVFINNFVIPDALAKRIVLALIVSARLAPGAQLVLMKPLLWGPHADDALFANFALPVRILQTPHNVVDWTHVRFYPVLYTLGGARAPPTPRDAQCERRLSDFRESWRAEYVRMIRSRPVNIGER